MSAIDKIQSGRRRLWRGFHSTLAAVGGLAICLGAAAQETPVTVDTVGGGVRIECGPAYGFAEGNTYEDAQFNGPYSCALDTNGNLWIADLGNSDLEQVSEAGNLAESETTAYYAVSGTAPHLMTNYHFLTNINSVVVDPGNNLYVLVPSPPQVYQCSLTVQSPTINILSYLQLLGTPTNVAATAMAVDGNSNVFLAFNNGVILKFQMLDFSPPPTVYSEGYALGATPAVQYIITGYNWLPAGMTLQADGNLAVSDLVSNAIYIVSTNAFKDNPGPQLLTGAHGAGYDDGSPEFAQFDQPHGLAASADGRLIVCDTENNRLRVIDTSSNTTTLYGTSSNVWTATCCTCDPTFYSGWVDGVAGPASNNASGRLPVSVTIGPGGSLFVTELYYSLIREVTNTDFTTVNLHATPPVAVTKPATGNSTTNATINGTVNPGDAITSYFFEWGTNAAYGNFTATNVLTANLTVLQNVSAALLNLTPDTTYHFQLVAFNGSGYSYGGDVIFITSGQAPVVITEPATNITFNGATLNANVNPDYSQTSVYFEWGVNTNFENTTTLIVLTNGLATDQAISTPLTGLQPGTIYYFRAVGFSTAGSTYGSTLAFSTLTAPPPTVSFSPSNGYFPECVTVTVTSSSPLVFFTTDGSTPTTNSTEVSMLATNGGYVGTLQWCNPQENLTSLQVIAVNGGNTTLVQGSLTSTNLIGFPRPLFGGSGGHLYIPVVVDLQSNATLKSVQFLVEVNANGSAPPITSMDLQPLTTNDFVQLPGPAPSDAPVAFYTTSYASPSNGVALVVQASGESSGLDMESPGIIVMLHLQVPSTALFGQSYSLTVLNPSGTSDGNRDTLGLATLPTQTLTVTDPAYMVGDSAPSYGYNAEQFGQGSLDNADVNNAIYASVGIRVPPSDSDAYNSMDAWPPDSAGRGGDGFIRLLDWETILARSLGCVPIYPGLDTNNYLRFWTNGDAGYPSHAVVDWVPGGPPVTLALDSDATSPDGKGGKLSLTNSPPGLVWFCQASVGSGTVVNAQPGNTVELPVYANVLPGYNLAALQFRSVVTPSSGAPALASIQFNPAPEVPAPQVLNGLSPSDKVQIWGFGTFAAPLENSNYLGTISFQIPVGAPAGANYALHFIGVDGAPGNAAYQLESHPGYAWVMSAALQPASITSDEWKLAFFGSLTNSQSADNVDADGDGALNWQEYVAGTNPTNALSYLQFTSASLNTTGTPGVAVNWLTAPGKNYLLRASSALTGAAWTTVSTNSGDGNEHQFIDTNFGGGARFYQIEIKP
jgi:NHL repeat